MIPVAYKVARHCNLNKARCRFYNMAVSILHNEEVPNAVAVPPSEFSQRIPVVGQIVGNSNPAVPLVVFQPAGDTRGRLKFNVGMGFEHTDDILCRGTKVHLSSANNFFFHRFFGKGRRSFWNRQII